MFQVRILAKEVHDKHFKAAQAQPRGVVAKLCNVVAQIDRACQKQLNNQKSDSSWQDVLKHALDELAHLLKDEKTVSAYEIHSSGLIQALLRLLSCNVSKISLI